MVGLNITTSPVDALQQINNLTIADGVPLLGIGVLFFIWFIIYYRSKSNYTTGNLAVATFFTSIIGIGMSYLGLIPDAITGLVVAASIISLAALMMQR